MRGLKIPNQKLGSQFAPEGIRHLLAGVVDLTEEVLFLVVRSVLGKVQAKDTPVNNEENSQKAVVVNSEPFVGSVGSKSRGGSQDSWDGSGNSSSNRLWLEGVQSGGRDAESCKRRGDALCEKTAWWQMVRAEER